MIHDAVTKADVYCYKPDVMHDGVTLLDTKEVVMPPKECPLVVVKENMDKVTQANIFAVLHCVVFHVDGARSGPFFARLRGPVRCNSRPASSWC